MYFTEQNLKHRGDSIELNLEPKDRAQRVDEENGVICLVIMFTSRVMAFKMLEIDNFIYFLLITAEI